MSEVHPTTRAKPNKPSLEFPLYAHASGRWAKRIRGKIHYFGPWADPEGALAKYLEQKDALHTGRKPRPDPEALTVKNLCNAFLNAKAAARDAGELAPRTRDDYKATCDLIVEHFGRQRMVAGLGPDDFADLRTKLAERWGPVTLANAIQRIRVVFKFASDNGMVGKLIAYGQGFKRPSKKTLRLDRAQKGPKLLTADEIRRLLDVAGVPMRAMLLLAINAGYGNNDCARLPLSALDLYRGWVDFPRPKTGIPRKAMLWPETVDALRQVLGKRPEPKDAADAGLVFVTKYGGGWGKEDRDNPISKEASKLFRAASVAGRKGLGFYTLRHVFRTIADEVKDQPAVNFIMGHARDDMASVYRERISDERLQAVTDHVRAWLWPTSTLPAADRVKSPYRDAGSSYPVGPAGA